MYKLVKKPNLEKERVKKLMKTQVQPGGPVTISMNGNGSSVMADSNNDSAEYYQEILGQPDFTDILYTPVLQGDSVAFQVNPHTAGMEFADYLHITYVKAKENADYPGINYQRAQKPGLQQSTLKMTEPVTLEIGSNGQMNDPLILLTSGYWSWKDKMATMLPFDYWPGKGK